MLRIVHTGCGAIEGIAAPEPEITVFRGIPFAAPPVGDLRWRAPQPVAAWAGTLAAHDFAPACPQPTPGDSNEFYDREWGTDPAIARGEQNEVEILLGNTTGEFMETDADGTLLPAGEVGNLKLIAEWIRSGRKAPCPGTTPARSTPRSCGSRSVRWPPAGGRSSDDTTTCHAGWSPTGRTSPPPETRTVPTRTARRCRNGHGTPRSAATPCGWVSGPV